MTGPSVKRLPASEPTLRDPALNVLTSIFGGGSTNLPPGWGRTGAAQLGVGGGGAASGTIQDRFAKTFGFTMPPELVNAFSNYLAQPSADQRTNAATLAMQGGTSNIPGFDVLNAAGPIFSRNLTESLARTRNVGPRFSSTADAQARLLEQQGLQDFNLFAQQVLEQGRQRQLQGILGFAQANQGQQQLQMQALIPLIQALFGGGLSPGVTVGPSPLGQALGAVGSIAGGAASLGFQPFKR